MSRRKVQSFLFDICSRSHFNLLCQEYICKTSKAWHDIISCFVVCVCLINVSQTMALGVFQVEGDEEMEGELRDEERQDSPDDNQVCCQVNSSGSSKCWLSYDLRT